VDEESRTASGLLDGMPAHLELTDERLVVRIGDEAVPRHDVAFQQITGIEDRTGLMTGFITIHLGEDTLTFSRIPKADVGPMAGALRARVAKAPPATEPGESAEPDTAAGDSPLAELERLARLRDAGVVTAEEFEAAKRTLLGRL
jgi:hypothetical protein